MSKAGAIAAMGVGGSGAALTTAYFAGVFGGNYDVVLPENLTNFQKEAGEEVEGCVLSLFPGIEDMKGDSLTDPTNGTPISENFFNENEGISSCFVVNWDKEETNSKDWKGNFKFLWAVKQEKENETDASKKKGFVIFVKASTGVDTSNSSTKKLNWEGIIYEIKHENSKWKKKNKQEITTKEQTVSGSYDKFPKAKDSLAEMKEKPFWGWTTSTDMTKIGSTLTNPSSSSFKGYWEWTSGGGTEKLEDWTTGLDNWWNDLFGKSKWDMPNVVKDKKGTWVNRTIENTPESKATSAGTGK